jgi:hypothetical protein
VTASSYTSLACRLPAVDSPLSLAAFGNVPTTLLRGTSSGAANHQRAFDDDFSSTVFSTSAESSSCVVDLDLGPSTFAMLARIRFFPVLKAEAKAYGGTFAISSDGAAFVDVATISPGIHAGWNFVDVAPATPVRVLRYRGPANSNCQMAELEYHGRLLMSDRTDGLCPVLAGVHAPAPHPSLGLVLPRAAPSVFPATALAAPEQVQFAVAATPVVTAIQPARGSSLGGESITLQGANLGNTASVVINGQHCSQVTVVDASTVTCVTGPRAGLQPLSLSVIAADGARAVSQEAVRFRYMDRWSLTNTWKNDEPPVEGDTVVIPADQIVLLDVSPPRLFLLLVQGELIFDDRDLQLDADYIMAHGGRIEIGTEARPYLHKATLTLYGDRFHSIGIPRAGAKMLTASNVGRANVEVFGEGALSPVFRRGALEIHGKPRRRVWTKVAATVLPGTTTIQLAEPVDFAAGELFILTSHTSFRETEELVVASLSADGLVVEVTTAVRHRHESSVEVVNGRTVDLRVEVGLLSRNIVIQGEPVTSARQNFGVHVMAMGGALLRLENAELRNCGQSGLLGRYCSHFHLASNQPDGYIRSNSIHHSFQRAITVHGTHRAQVWNNVAYHVKGHTVRPGLLCTALVPFAPPVPSCPHPGRRRPGADLCGGWERGGERH